MIQYKEATASDLEQIAQLHATSWQVHYRDSFSDHYLDGPVFEERLKVWQERFEKPNPKQKILLAKDADHLCGFICYYLDHHPDYGALIDNLHVKPAFQGNGIGKTLMQKAAINIAQNQEPDHYYLYVLVKNSSAIDFYKRLGGRIDGLELFKNPDGEQSEVYRVIWPG